MCFRLLKMGSVYNTDKSHSSIEARFAFDLHRTQNLFLVTPTGFSGCKHLMETFLESHFHVIPKTFAQDNGL